MEKQIITTKITRKRLHILETMRHRTAWGSEEQSPSHADHVGKADYGPDCPGRSHILHGGNTVNHQRGPQTGTVAGSPRWCPQDRWQQRSRHTPPQLPFVSGDVYVHKKKEDQHLWDNTFSMPLPSHKTANNYHYPNSFAWSGLAFKAFHPQLTSPPKCGIPTDLPNRSSTWNVFLPPGCLSKFHPLYTCPHLWSQTPSASPKTNVSGASVCLSIWPCSPQCHWPVWILQTRRMSYISSWMLYHLIHRWHSKNVCWIEFNLNIVSCFWL